MNLNQLQIKLNDLEITLKREKESLEAQIELDPVLADVRRVLHQINLNNSREKLNKPKAQQAFDVYLNPMVIKVSANGKMSLIYPPQFFSKTFGYDDQIVNLYHEIEDVYNGLEKVKGVITQ
jgi:hypothetical protein